MTLTLTTEIGKHLAGLMRLESEVSREYNLLAYRDIVQANEIRRYLFERRLFEFMPPYGRVLLEDDQLVGMLACLPGPVVSSCRLRMALELRQAGFFAQDPGLSKRMQLAGQILAKPGKEDYYLSRIAVTRKGRGRGLGTYLLKEYEQLGVGLNCRRFLLEVSAKNKSAIRFYRRHNYAEIDLQEVHDKINGRSLEYLHMAKNNDRVDPS